MSLLDPPGLRPGDALPWSVVSSRPVKSGGSATSPTSVGVTNRYSEVAPFDLVAVQLVYANWQNYLVGESPNYNGYRVKAAVHKGGTAAPDRALTDWMAPGTFGGREYGYCQPGGFLLTDPIWISVRQGERWFHESYADVYLGAAPAAPTLTATGSGGSFGAGTAYVVISYVYPDGSESLPSAEGSVTITAGQSIVVTAPAAQPGISGWRAYIAQPNSSAGTVKYESPTAPMAPLGTNITFSGSFATSNLHRIARNPSNVGLPLGQGFLGGIGGTSIGEGTVSGRDYTTAAVTMTGAPGYSTAFGPIGVLGIAADGRLHRSVALFGDSIQGGTGDSGYGGALGGFAFRACANQTQQMPFDTTKTPKVGFLQLAQGGETAATFATVGGSTRRSFIAERATTIVDNYGTNDLGGGSATIYSSLLTIFTRYQNRKRYFHTTLNPRTGSSSDQWLTVAGQTMTSTDVEADRRAINNCLRDSSGAATVTGEALFRSPGSGTSATSFYSGGDGSAVKFYTAYPFQTGTEVVKVAGVTKAVTTDYTYRQTAVIGGVTYASGISFVTAPANAATVTATYTKIASFPSLAGWTGTIDTASAVEVDGSGNPGTNGGFWKAAVTTPGITSTVTAASGNTMDDTAQTWTVDQWRGYVVRITADPTTPGSVGQNIAVQANTATRLTLAASWSTAPSSAATYQLYRPHTIDGTHPTSYGHLLKSQAIDVSKF
jgi:hypothetical protein